MFTKVLLPCVFKLNIFVTNLLFFEQQNNNFDFFHVDNHKSTNNVSIFKNNSAFHSPISELQNAPIAIYYESIIFQVTIHSVDHCQINIIHKSMCHLLIITCDKQSWSVVFRKNSRGRRDGDKCGCMQLHVMMFYLQSPTIFSFLFACAYFQVKYITCNFDDTMRIYCILILF